MIFHLLADDLLLKLKSLNYKPSSIPSGGLDVPLLLKFESQDKRVTDTMEFVENLYSFDFAWDFVVNDEDEEEIDFETFKRTCKQIQANTRWKTVPPCRDEI